MPRREAIRRDVSASMLREAAVRLVQEMELLRLRCIFCRMCMYLARYVEASGITEKHWKLSTRERAYMMFLT